MKLTRLFAALAILPFLASGAIAQVTNGKVTTAAPSYTNNTIAPLSITPGGGLRVETTPATGSLSNVNITQVNSSAVNNTTAPIPVGFYNPGTGALLDPTTPSQVVGNVASGVTDSGNPVKVAGKYNASQPLLTDGQRSDIQLDTRGNIRIVACQTGTAAPNCANVGAGSADGFSAFDYGLVTNSRNWVYSSALSGSERVFSCGTSVAINVTAGSTLELVALSGTQIIRVCGYMVTASVNGTAKFVYGTGANCGTGTTDITGAMAIAANSNNAMQASNASVFRAASANALCLVATGGNITGFLSYARY